MKDMKTLCDQVRQIAYDIHAYHGHGHLEINDESERIATAEEDKAYY